MKGDLTSQTLLTHAWHHCAVRLEVRMGLPATVIKTGCVCADGTMRKVTQALRTIGILNLIDRGVPSASDVALLTVRQFTISSTGTSRVLPMRAHSRCCRRTS